MDGKLSPRVDEEKKVENKRSNQEKMVIIDDYEVRVILNARSLLISHKRFCW